MAADFSLLFDLDGTLVDTDELHLHAFQAVLSPFGRTMARDDYKRHIMGQPTEAIMAWLFPEVPAAEHGAISERKEILFRQSVRLLTPTAGLIDLLDWAAARDIRMAVVTNAPRPNAELMLHGLGIDQRFDALVIGDELERGKPDPLPYRTALQRLSGHADRALAFEDSLPGIRAAVGAGVFTYGLRTAHDDKSMLESGAGAAISDFTDRGLWRKLDAVLGK
jgi:HAD superfamily hydrolase (TIGR01509 family)